MQDYLVIALDRPGSAELRQSLRGPHLAYVADKQDRFRYGGPILAEDGTMAGSVMILSLPDRRALDAHLAADPYFAGGLFQDVTIQQTRQVVPESEQGALAREAARQAGRT